MRLASTMRAGTSPAPTMGQAGWGAGPAFALNHYGGRFFGCAFGTGVGV